MCRKTAMPRRFSESPIRVLVTASYISFRSILASPVEHWKDETDTMGKKFKIGDHVRWNSEAGRVSGTIIVIHTKNFNYKGYTHHASEDDPQYEIKSDKTAHVAAHKGSALEHA